MSGNGIKNFKISRDIILIFVAKIYNILLFVIGHSFREDW